MHHKYDLACTMDNALNENACAGARTLLALDATPSSPHCAETAAEKWALVHHSGSARQAAKVEAAMQKCRQKCVIDKK